MIAKLEMTPSNAQQNKDQTQNFLKTMGATINDESINSKLWIGQQPKPPEGRVMV